MRLNLLLVIWLFTGGYLTLFSSCTTAQNFNYFKNSGLVENVSLEIVPGLTPLEKPELEIRSKVWYRDSFAIEEILSIKTVINHNIEKTWFIKEYYRFNDIRNRMIYLYKNLSDTAVCYKKYSFDAGIEVEAGWGFNFVRKREGIEMITPMSDTIIDHVNYKRLLLRINKKNSSPYNICFFRCDKSIYPFNFDIPLSEKMQCPLVRLDYMDISLTNISLINEIKFVSDKLTNEEEKIFDAWEKYVKNNL